MLTKFLLDKGLNMGLTGFFYIGYMMLTILKNPNKIFKNKELMLIVAEHYNTTPSKVDGCVRFALKPLRKNYKEDYNLRAIIYNLCFEFKEGGKNGEYI